MINENYWKDKRVLITGGTGYLGTEITSKLLNLGAIVTCFTKDNPDGNSLFCKYGLDKKTTLVLGDILKLQTVMDTLEKYQIEVIFHLASQPIAKIGLEYPFNTINTNVLGTTTLLEACRLNKSIKSILITSSIHAYNPKKSMPFREEDELKGEYPYEASKSCLDIISQCYGRTYNLPIGITRFSNIYGGGDLRFDRLVSKTIKDIIKNKRITLVHEGQPIREFLYIQDAVTANILLAEKIEKLNMCGEAFNFGSEKTYKIVDVVNMLLEVGLELGYNSPEIVLDKKEIRDVKDLYPSSEKAKQILGWSPEYSLKRGLLETFKWYVNYFKSTGAVNQE